MVNCVIKQCRNYTNSVRKKKSNATFHRFPKDQALADGWVKVIQESRNEPWWKPFPTATICSAHFHKKDKFVTKSGLHRIKPGAIPSKAMFLNSLETDSDESEKENVLKVEYLSDTSSYVISYVSEKSQPKPFGTSTSGITCENSHKTFLLTGTQNSHDVNNTSYPKQNNILEEALLRSEIDFVDMNDIPTETLPCS